MLKKISHIFEFLFSFGISMLVYPIAFSQLSKIAILLYYVSYPIAGAARRRVRDNIAFALPELQTEAEKRAFVKRNLIHTIRVSLEVLQAGKFGKKSFMKKYIVADEPDWFLTRTKASVGIEGHFGNWEIPAAYYGNLGVKVTVSAKHQSNPYVDWLLASRRKKYRVKIAYVDESTNLAKDLKKGEHAGLVADQNAGPEGIFVDFLGRKASTYAGPAVLTYLAETSLAVYFCIYIGKGRYHISSKEVFPESLKRKDFKNRQEALQIITQTWVAALEEMVRKHPEQYFFVHRRWKTRPPGEQ